MEVFLLLLVFGWILFDWLRDKMADRREAERAARKVAMRRQILARDPNSPAAYEMLGDAMREAGEFDEAISCYEEALSWGRKHPDLRAGSGWVPGAGLENKLRLTRHEMAETRAPEDFGQTMRTRQQICRACGTLGMPQDRDCANCGAPLPVDSILDTWRHGVMRRSIIAETVQTVVLFGVVVVVVAIASWMPLEVRGALLIAAIIVIPFRLLKRLGDG